MERKLKDLFRRPGSRRSLDSNASPRSSLDRAGKQPTQHGSQGSQTPPARTSQGSYPVSSPQRDRAKSVTAYTDPTHPNSIKRRPVNKEAPTITLVNQSGNSTQDSIAENYAAYQRAITSSQNTNDTQYGTTGGEKRLRHSSSTLKHNEDIADRNIERFSSAIASSRHSSLDGGDKRASVGSLGKSSSGKNFSGRASFSSAGKTSLSKHLAEIDALLVAEDPSTSEHNVKRVSVASLGKPSRTGSTGRASRGSVGKTSVGRETGEIDALLVAAGPSDSESLRSDQRDYPVRVARDEAHMAWRRRRSSSDSIDDNAPRASNYGPRNVTIKPSDGMTSGAPGVDGGNDFQEYSKPTEYISRDRDEKPSLEGILDLNDSVDVDRTTRWAPAVTHEIVKPTEHEIIQERIYREIHNYDVYHRIQPVYETEILPARHFIPNPNGEGLLEVSADQFPGCTGANQRWFIGERELPAPGPPSRHSGLKSPKIIDEKRYMTEEGYERIETTILHPQTLEDLSKYSGPVLPMRFVHHPDKSEEEVQNMNNKLDSVPEVLPLTLKELSDALPEDHNEPIPDQFVPPRQSSVRDRKSHGVVAV
ncbi:hypothetical protein K491DRAFT_452949 [Lophiostoma macrostomum CBS 122681]|uniref:Uncharacterized protein n=1 Tax=Lophiostoma macrostomum CBS 122681 TaxID=1314788 RepID=A0A6A6TQ14_9PLEO|nr:hypothetical protein K491DRAFT_452949 [Lophiostoma macrostomum CBS 122681]